MGVTKVKLRYWVIIFLAFMLVTGYSSYADPKIRCSLFDTDMLRIPDRYHGLWATSRDSCGVSRDYGVQILINEMSIGNTNVLRVQAFVSAFDASQARIAALTAAGASHGMK